MSNYFTLTLLGFLLSWVIDISQRDKKSRRTPERFKLMFFLKDNETRIFYSLCTSLLIILIFHYGQFEIHGYENYFAVAVGFCPDLVIGWLKRKFGFLKNE